MTALDAINIIEDGTMSYQEYLDAFQCLIDSGYAWILQGSYGRIARELIQEGLCTLPERAS